MRALGERSLLIPTKQKALKKYVSPKPLAMLCGGCVMNGKQRAQWIEFRRQLCSEYSDTEIAKRARSVLRWKIRYDSIQVTAENGHLTLFGEVNWELDREAAEQTVRKLNGVTGVTNLLTTKGCAVPFHFLPRHRVEATKDVEDL
jgi:osmotically-inducible protein OsmY